MGCASSNGVVYIENEEGLLRQPPDRPGVITPQWVTREMKRGGVDIEIDDVIVEQITSANIDNEQRGDGGGISGSRILRLRLVYTSGTRKKLPNGADTLVLKWTSFRHVPPMPITLRIAQVILFKVDQANLFRTEHFFMRDVRDVHKWGVKTAKTYSTAKQEGKNPSDIARLACDSRANLITMALMEDIGKYKTPAPPFAPVSRNKAAAALRNVARLHKSTWGKMGKFKTDLVDIYGNKGFATSHTGLNGLKGTGAHKKKKNFAKSNAPENLVKKWNVGILKTDKGIQAIARAASNPILLQAFKDLQANWSTVYPNLGNDTPQCMVHGDFHHWNNLYGETDDDVMLIDWQYFGCGRVSYELLYFFNAGIDFTTVEDDVKLLQEYYNSLVEGVNPPQITFGELLLDFRYAIIDACVTMCLSLGERTMGVSYTVSDYMKFAQDPKQRDFAVGGMMLSGRMFDRLVGLFTYYGGVTEMLKDAHGARQVPPFHIEEAVGRETV
eukprot:TRINITY_DN11825_c0_g1_i1.p1 TRINITY_DN11825_c0_g1~~TRINITY_DN11825_c0_g1_i1.p1  ORF type:complete len:514 (+),score=64.75 TRINITY_DN11825_c0_g1_i1:48-1544(+)